MEHGTNHNAERIRQLVDIAYGCGRGWQSSQTGYIHYSYSILDEDFHHPIPVYENLLFALALMRTRNVENITEAKELLGRLLYFQNDQEGIALGNFPIYLHEYPFCRDRQQAALVLPVLYWIYKSYHHVIGVELKARLENSLKNALDFSLKMQKERELPFPLVMKIAASAKAIGLLLNVKDYESDGDTLLKSFEHKHHIASWNSPTAIADLLIAFQMIYPEISKSPEVPFWHHISNTWHRSSESYCGPGWREYQRGIDPQPTLYDYYLGFFAGKFNYRCFLNHPIQLQAALVHASHDELPKLQYPLKKEGSIEGTQYKIFQEKPFAYSLLAKPQHSIQILEKALHSLKLLWGDGCSIHSLVYQPTTAAKVDFDAMDTEMTLFITLPDEPPGENKEKNQEVSLFVDQAESLKVRVQDQPSTTFQLGDSIVLVDDSIEMKLSFHLHEGNGTFFGHVMKGNRPSQIDLKGKRRFEAYDWQIFLRSIQRESHCVIKVVVKVSAKN